ncbi:MAG: chemotaxis response regulator protein-glutamate methylesterase [Phycisphaeraceae bacterium]|nr:chemotaxis response regulator protein-glutamate methylesterase [Phycisphaeraceae bacterium]
MRVLVVDDSAFMRRAIKQMLQSDPAIEVVGVANNGREGFELAKKLEPDVITLDIEMPEMDGLTALRHIMRECPTQVVMVSSLTTEGSHASLTALRLGAADFLAKDMSQISLSVTNIQEELLTKVRALGAAPKHRLKRGTAFAPVTHAVPTYRPGQFDVICIGSSTGGPPVLETVLPSLPATLTTPVVVAQHMPEIFTRSMAERLNESCQIPVVHAENHMPLAARTIYIAPGGKNIHLHKTGLARWEMLVNDEPKEALYRPSVDALLASAAKATGARTLAVVLTGIGEDGLQGARPLHAIGGTILSQSQETCVVYGMPKAVTQAALIQASLTPEQIAQSLQSLARQAAA